jgi:YbbR domain-containing protein
MILSLLLATLVWIAAVREQNPPREDDYDQNIPVEVIPAAAGLITVDLLPQTVQVRLLAPQSSWSTLTASKFKASLDLSQLPPGFNDVPVQVNVSDPQITIIDQNPKAVSINLQPEQTITLPVRVEIMDQPPLGYINRAPVANPPAVQITGPVSLINQVDRVVSELFIRAAKETIERTEGVIIRNREDQILNGLKVTPPKIQITLPIEQRFGYKDVSVSAVVRGKPASGYWVNNIIVSPPQVTVVGNPQVLASLPGFIETAPIDVNGATEDIVRSVPLNLPNGVTQVMPQKEAGSAGGVQVTIEVAAIESGQTVQRLVTQQGIDPDFVWVASPERADVILSGPIPRLQTLKSDDIKVIVDLFGLQPGTHKVKPTVFAPDNLQVEAVLPEIIEITITVNPQLPTPAPTPTATLNFLPSSSPIATPTPLAKTGTPILIGGE